jgi:hypothetical protein
MIIRRENMISSQEVKRTQHTVIRTIPAIVKIMGTARKSFSKRVAMVIIKAIPIIISNHAYYAQRLTTMYIIVHLKRKLIKCFPIKRQTLHYLSFPDV